jgi:hypothetical protein
MLVQFFEAKHTRAVDTRLEADDMLEGRQIIPVLRNLQVLGLVLHECGAGF